MTQLARHALTLVDVRLACHPLWQPHLPELMILRHQQVCCLFTLFQLEQHQAVLAYLGSILPPKMAEDSLRAMCLLLPEIDHT